MTRFPDQAAILTALREGAVTLQGQFLHGSNYTFLGQVRCPADPAAEAEAPPLELPIVYKPVRGEQPLWDFPTGSLAKREVAAYLVSESLGWQLVPPTVFRRRRAPLGRGSLQLYIPHDPQDHYFNFSEVEKQRLRPAALFDLLINNADRKGSHILHDAHNQLWLIDHGICFHAEDKLRTVIWDFAGEAVPPDLLADLARWLAELEQSAAWTAELFALLNKTEIKALVKRARRLLSSARFPLPDQKVRSFPWPPV